jgi:hypothetical protein
MVLMSRILQKNNKSSTIIDGEQQWQKLEDFQARSN